MKGHTIVSRITAAKADSNIAKAAHIIDMIEECCYDIQIDDFERMYYSQR